MRLYYDRWEEAGQFLRLLVHDELFCEAPLDEQEKIDRVLQEEMEKPIPELALPSTWGMGEALVILTEAKTGHPWGQMH
jgi:DNA polymerase I-like protein with 3'-5' exonuclease and polymerase domains